jgi:PadR family transcriptional regulator PadR
MSGPYVLNDVEQLILVAVARLKTEAYGVSIRAEIEARAGRLLSTAATYAALERLESRGLVVFSLSEPTPERGGRRKKVYRVTGRGATAALAARDGLSRLWEGVELSPRRSA